MLRHSQLSVTQSCCIKTTDTDVRGAMQKSKKISMQKPLLKPLGTAIGQQNRTLVRRHSP